METEKSELKQIEINGVKLDVDLRTARRIDEFKVGDNVKVLRKSYSGYEVQAGVIVEFVNFKELPTIQIAVFKNDYSGSTIEFINFNSQTENIEIAFVSAHEVIIEKNRVLDKINDAIDKKKNEMDELIAKKEYFLNNFQKYFED
jgi:hypothetical protein